MAGTYNLIPVTSNPDQRMTVTIPVNGQNVTLRLRIRYNAQGGYWWMAVSDQSGNLLVDAVPLVTGDYPAGDLLGQYQYLGIGSCVVVNAGNTALDSPDDTSLGVSFFLAWGDSA